MTTKKISNLTAGGHLIVAGNKTTIQLTEEEGPRQRELGYINKLRDEMVAASDEFSPLDLLIDGEKEYFRYDNPSLRKFIVHFDDKSEVKGESRSIELSELLNVVHQKKITCLCGESGSGKSTLAKVFVHNICEGLLEENAQKIILPVFLNYSEWNRNELELHEWVREKLSEVQDVSVSYGFVLVVVDGIINVNRGQELTELIATADRILPGCHFFYSTRTKPIDQELFDELIVIQELTLPVAFNFLAGIDPNFSDGPFFKYLNHIAKSAPYSKYIEPDQLIRTALDAVVHYSVFVKYYATDAQTGTLKAPEEDSYRMLFGALFFHAVKEDGDKHKLHDRDLWDFSVQLAINATFLGNNFWCSFSDWENPVLRVASSSGIFVSRQLVDGQINLRFKHDFIRNYFLGEGLSSDPTLLTHQFSQAGSMEGLRDLGRQMHDSVAHVLSRRERVPLLIEIGKSNPLLLVELVDTVQLNLDESVEVQSAICDGFLDLLQLNVSPTRLGTLLKPIVRTDIFFVVATRWLITLQNPAIRKLVLNASFSWEFNEYVSLLIVGLTDENRSVRRVAISNLTEHLETKSSAFIDACQRGFRTLSEDRKRRLVNSVSLLRRSEDSVVIELEKVLAIDIPTPTDIIKTTRHSEEMELLRAVPFSQLVYDLGGLPTGAEVNRIVKELANRYEPSRLEYYLEKLQAGNIKHARRIPRILSRARAREAVPDLVAALESKLDDVKRTGENKFVIVVVHLIKALNELSPHTVLEFEDRLLSIHDPNIFYHVAMNRVNNGFAVGEVSSYFGLLNETELWLKGAMEVILSFGTREDIARMINEIERYDHGYHYRIPAAIRGIQKLASPAFNHKLIRYIRGKSRGQESLTHSSRSAFAARVFIEINGQEQFDSLRGSLGEDEWAEICRNVEKPPRN